MEELVKYLVSRLVDDPEAVSVESSEQNGITVINIIAGKDEIGKVIGKQGRIAHAIRTLVKAAAGSKSRKISVEIIER